MAATADPRAKPPAAASHHLKPWAPPRAHRVPSLPDVSGGGARDRRRSSSSSSSSRRRGDAAGEKGGPRDDGRLEDLRAKLMGHLRDAADRLRLPAPPKPRSPSPDPAAAPLPLPTPPQQEAPPAARPWNLRDRKRRPSARAAAAAASSSPATWEPEAEKALSDERAPFAVALSAEEVEEDIYALTGARPRRRPRKRPRVVQRQLDTLFPGLWLTEITADAYKVPDE